MLRFVKQGYGSKSNRSARKAPLRGRRSRTFEALDTRRMFDATGVVDAGILFISGTSYNDVVEVSNTAQGDVLVRSSSDERSGEAFNHYSGVTKIVFLGGLGNDQFLNRTSFPLEAYGGAGNDKINVGNSITAYVEGEEDDDVLMGNDFDNVLDGGDGNDTLYGFGGNDVLFGGKSFDRIWGGRGRDIIFGGGGADMLAGEGDIDFLDGGVDSTPDTIYAKGDGANDVIVQESGVSTFGDRDSGDRVLKSNDDYEASFRATGKLPVSIGVTSSGYAIGGGISFQFAAQDHGTTVVKKNMKTNPTAVDASFANWTGAGLSQYGELDASAGPGNGTVEEALPGNYVEQTPVDRSEPLSSNAATPVDVSPTDPAFDAYYEQIALVPLKPAIASPAVKTSLTTSVKRF